MELSYDALWQVVDDNWKRNPPYASKAGKVYLKKAKQAKDTDELFPAYRSAAWAHDGEVGQRYADTLIALSQEQGDYNSVASGYYIKGGKYYLESKNKLALEHLILSYRYAEEADQPVKMANALDIISGIMSQFGGTAKAIEVQRKALNIITRNKERIDDYDFYRFSYLDGMARQFARMQKIDSARYYNDLARSLLPLAGNSAKENEKDLIRSQVLDANINFYDNIFLKARDTLLKYRKFDPGYGEADKLYYLGAIAGKLEGPEQKRYYFEQLDSILLTIDLPLIDHIEEVYPFLLEEALKRDEKELAASYLERLKYYDSLRVETERFTEETTLKELDLPLQEQEKANFEFEILRRTKFLYGAIALAVIALLGSVVFFLRYKRIKRKFEHIMQEDVLPIVEQEEVAARKDLQIDAEVIREVLGKLAGWEKDLGYLEKDIDQNELAKRLGTNSTYLSRIINNHKKQGFSSYLKDLRVTYAINYAKTHPEEMPSRSLVQWAEQFGFNSVDVFVRTFKSKVGITPAVFFRRLKKGNL